MNQKMFTDGEHVFRVGLTGGIASGKSFVADQFADLGAQIIDTDKLARQIVAPGQPALEEISAEFGAGILAPDGGLDRRALRERIFTDTDRRRRLEAILHPRIRRKTLELAASAGGPYQLLIVPLLIETGFQDLVDRILVVDCPESLQRQRLIERDAEDPEQVDRIMAAQLSRPERLAAADDVIDNAGDPADTRVQVEALHRGYLDLAG